MILTSSNWDDRTKGNKKIDDYFSTLLRNKEFKDEIQGWKDLISLEDNTHSKIEKAYKLYQEYKKEEIKLTRYLNSRDSIKLKRAICLKYNLSDDWFDTLTLDHPKSRASHTFDTCYLSESEDRKKSALDIHSFHIRLEDNVDHVILPVNIKIHINATKNDILSLIETRWQDVLIHLRKKRFKSKKIDNKMLDFIWDNRKLKSKDIIKKMDEEFPKHGLAYFEVNKIITDERKRLKKMTSNDDLLSPYYKKINKYLEKPEKRDKKMGNSEG